MTGSPMNKHIEQSEELQSQIKDLRLEIAKLSALLAFRKLESAHPALEKLVQGATAAENLVKRQAEDLEQFAHKKLHCPCGSLGIIGRIFLIGTVGYTLLAALGLTGRAKK